MDKIFIRDLKVPTIIGIYAAERAMPQELSFDIEVSTDIMSAAKSDDLADTLDYASLRDLVIQTVQKANFQLVETLAEHIAEAIQRTFGTKRLRLVITKQPYDIPDAEGVGVVIERSYN